MKTNLPLRIQKSDTPPEDDTLPASRFVVAKGGLRTITICRTKLHDNPSNVPLMILTPSEAQALARDLVAFVGAPQLKAARFSRRLLRWLRWEGHPAVP
jgi:hypothetical protein